jgi:hypothetical protein
MKQFITLFLLFITLCIVSISCKKDSGDSNPAALSGNTLSGKIKNWTNGNDKTIAAWASYSTQVGTSAISADGSFSIVLGTPAAGSLEPITQFIDPSISYSDSTSKATNLGLYVMDNSSSYFGQLERTNDISEDAIGFVRVVYVYVTKSTTVKGNVDYSDTDFEETDNFDLNLKAGWNTVSIECTKATSTSTFTTVESKVRSFEPSTVNWKFNTGKK